MTINVRVGDFGTIFETTVVDEDEVVQDISSASTKNMIFRKPDGTVVTQTTALSTDGTDGKCRYTTVDGDIDMAGEWQRQVHIAVGGGEWHTSITVFDVDENLD